MKTEVFTVTDLTQDAQKIAAAARIVATGGLVAFPTETVYGIACLAEPEAIARLDRIKGRSAEKRYTVHIADKQRVADYVPHMLPHVRKLVLNGWPGPITIVFELDEQALESQRNMLGDRLYEILYRDGTIGIRCVAHTIGAAFLREIKGTVVAPSANRAGREPATTARRVLDIFDGGIDAVIDAGASHSQINSTVVKAGKGPIEILRQGAVGSGQIAELAQVRILFVCTGNTCRSPMAEGLCRKIISEKLNCSVDAVEATGYKIRSAGVAACLGADASPEAIKVCGEYGIDISRHNSRPLDIAEALSSDYIFVMGRTHQAAIGHLVGRDDCRCQLLDGLGDIPDPIGAPVNVYRECAERILEPLEGRISEIWDENSSSK
jgi:protein-tyrosine phosphatase